MRARRLFLMSAAAGLALQWPSFAWAEQGSVDAESGGIAIGGHVEHSCIGNCSITPEQLQAIIKQSQDLSEAQKKIIANLEHELDLNREQIQAALNILGAAKVPPEKLTAALIETAQRFKDLQRQIAVTPTGDDQQLAALKGEAERAIKAGDLSKAEKSLLQIKSLRREARKRLEAESARLAADEATTTAQLGDIASTRLHYNEAAQRFAEAAALIAPGGADEKQRVEYLEKEAAALFRQGDEFGDNAALKTAIERYRSLLDLRSRERFPLDWAWAQNNLGVSLAALGGLSRGA